MKHINGRPISGFSILKNHVFASDGAALASLLEQNGISLPVVENASGDCIRFDDRCNSYHGHRCALRVRQSDGGLQIILDGETAELRQKAMAMLLTELEANEEFCIFPDDTFGYLWPNHPVSDLKLIRLQKDVGEDGVTYYEADYRNRDGKPVRGFAVAGDPAKTRIAVEAAPSGITEIVSTHALNAEKRGETVLAGANAGFFHFFSQNSDLTPYGPQIIDGEVLCPPSTVQRYGNLYVGCTYDDEVIFSDCKTYFEHWEGKLRYAVGGGPMLMINGVIPPTEANDSSAPAFFPSAGKPGPCTFFAHCADGTSVIFCADGRQETSAGMTYADKVQFAMDLDLDCVNIFNLDGGGSTVMVRRDDQGQFVVKNSPCSDPQRPVADAIFLVKK